MLSWQVLRGWEMWGFVWLIRGCLGSVHGFLSPELVKKERVQVFVGSRPLSPARPT